LDRNYGGILIIWDKMFGTFAEEIEPVEYGILNPVRSWNPGWCNIAYIKTIWGKMGQAPNLAKKLYAVIAPPEWSPIKTANSAPKKKEMYNSTCSSLERWTVMLVFFICLAMLGYILTVYKSNIGLHYAIALIATMCGLQAIGAFFDQKAGRYWWLGGHIVGISLVAFHHLGMLQ
jgi:sterol desaturase/sphingolipid hydroxylase (fatty acid hydroxylase superfamily)